MYVETERKRKEKKKKQGWFGKSNMKSERDSTQIATRNHNQRGPRHQQIRKRICWTKKDSNLGVKKREINHQANKTKRRKKKEDT